jgi:CheY-like chemotaxis protein/HPt (histidine-containing phosphotransfer) domain-containing protein
MDDYLTKPVDPQQLVDRIIRWITKSREIDATGPGAPAAPQAPRHAILMAEDDDILQEYAAEILRGAGYEVDQAPDGIEALKLAEKKRYDLILIDGCMPKMDGFEACRNIRACRTNARTPVVVVTGSVADGLKGRIREAGMNDYLLKPYHAAQLLEKVAAWLKNPEPPQPAGAPELIRQSALIHYPSLLDGCMGDEALAWRLLQKFTARIDNDVEWLRRAVVAGDMAEVGRAAHKIKGSTASLAMRAIANLVAGLEEQAKGGSLADASQDFGEIERMIESVKSEIQGAGRE